MRGETHDVTHDEIRGEIRDEIRDKRDTAASRHHPCWLPNREHTNGIRKFLIPQG
jgi:hypothetical protein